MLVQMFCSWNVPNDVTVTIYERSYVPQEALYLAVDGNSNLIGHYCQRQNVELCIIVGPFKRGISLYSLNSGGNCFDYYMTLGKVLLLIINSPERSFINS